MHLISGLLAVSIGLLGVTHPAASALAFTLLFASFLTVIGAFRMVAAISLKFPNWGWSVFDGGITAGLGILVWAEWPSSAIWFLGLALGVSLVLRGWSYIMFSIALRTWTVPVPIKRAAA